MCNCQGNSGKTCQSNDYSLHTANTGIATISSANSSLTGSNATAVLSASSGFNGTIVKSVRLKATQPVTKGMVRLFLANNSVVSLYKEIMIPETPMLRNTPIPTPLLPTYEVLLEGGLCLEEGAQLLAATQNGESFNVIAEGLDWKYPDTIPSTCCNFKQITSVTGVRTVSTANSNLDGSGTITKIFEAPSSNGATIKTITIKALQSTSDNGMIRLFISPDGATYSLLKEITIPQSTQSSFEPSFKVVLEEDLSLQQGYSLGAATQLAQSFALTVEGLSWSYPIS